MSDDIKNNVITIASFEQKTASNGNPFFKIKDGNNLSYTMWTTKKDGSEQKCFTYFKTLGLEATGKTVDIGYKEEKGDYNGKEVIYRTIIGMKEPSEIDQKAIQSNEQKTVSGKELLEQINSLKIRVSVLEGKLSTQEPKQGLEGQNLTNTAPQVDTAEQFEQPESEEEILAKIPF